MNYFDIIFGIILIMFGITGYKRGFFRETLNLVGLILILFISFLLMGPIGDILLKYLPFLSLSIIGVEIEALNIFFYQVLAFIILTIILYVIWDFVLTITGLLSKIVGLNKFLRLPFRILGAVAGIIGGYIIIFLLLLAFGIPLNSRFTTYKDSRIKNHIMNNKLLFTNEVVKLKDSINEIYDLTYVIDKDEKRLRHSEIYNTKVMDIMLKNKMVKKETIEELIRRNKIHTYPKLESVINKY